MKKNKIRPELSPILSPLVGIFDIRVYESEDKSVQNSLKRRITKISKLNENIDPYIDNEHVCDTCGTVGKCHPDTGYCFICDTDNWRNIKPY